VALREIEEGRGEITLFYEPATGPETRLNFEAFVRVHLEARALPDSIRHHRVVVCPDCDTPISDMAAARRRDRGFDWIECNVCGRSPISLQERDERPEQRTTTVREMDNKADARRDEAASVSIVEGKRLMSDFDVFLCHNSTDKSQVKAVGERLKERSILPWLDEWELQPGLPWQKALEQQIATIKAAAIFVGDSGIGPWEDMEVDAFIREFVTRRCPVIPVILPGCKEIPELPIFLRGMTWVDFRKLDPDPLGQLFFGITGKRPLRG
jgi:hypothetical protein